MGHILIEHPPILAHLLAMAPEEVHSRQACQPFPFQSALLVAKKKRAAGSLVETSPK